MNWIKAHLISWINKSQQASIIILSGILVHLLHNLLQFTRIYLWETWDWGDWKIFNEVHFKLGRWGIMVAKELDCLMVCLQFDSIIGQCSQFRLTMELFRKKWRFVYANCKTYLVKVLHKLSLLFWNFINTTAYHFGQYQPSSHRHPDNNRPLILPQMQRHF